MAAPRRCSEKGAAVRGGAHAGAAVRGAPELLEEGEREGVERRDAHRRRRRAGRGGEAALELRRGVRRERHHQDALRRQPLHCHC